MSKKLVAWFGDSWNNPKLLAPSSNVVNLFRTLLSKELEREAMVDSYAPNIQGIGGGMGGMGGGMGGMGGSMTGN